MFLENSPIINNYRLKGGYYQVDFAAPQILTQARPGQFVHVRLPLFHHRVLRRPFSIFAVDASEGLLKVIYKVVGEGTRHLSELEPGVEASLMGPLGNGYTVCSEDATPIIVAGGYGCAATYMLACRVPAPPVCLLGGRTADDLLLTDEYQQLGATLKVATDDGSAGHKGFITEVLKDVLDEHPDNPRIYACGPNPMLKSVTEIVLARGLDAEVSLDHAMCCGVGACFACVVKMKDDSSSGWKYVRTCKEGPVFKASETVWD